jgi:integrase
MPRAKRPKPLYQRGKYRLDPPRAGREALTITWYDPERKRERSVSTGTADVGESVKIVDRMFDESQGRTFCPTCGQPIQGIRSPLVADAIASYMRSKELLPGADVIRYRLRHVTDYLAEIGGAELRTSQIDKHWIENFRRWLLAKPVVAGSTERERALSTVENSVLQLAAAINYADDHGARFRPIQAKEVNRTPLYRANVDTLAAMFEYAMESEKKKNLLHFLRLSVLTLGRPDAVLEASTDPAKGQWNPGARIFNLNPKNRRQTKKYRPTVPVARQGVEWLNSLPRGPIVTVNSIRKAWDTMAENIGLPGDRESGAKLIRRSMADLLRSRMRSTDWGEIEAFLGHQRFDSVSELYAPLRPDYLANARASIEQIISEIEEKVPGAFYRADTAQRPNSKGKKAA